MSKRLSDIRESFWLVPAVFAVGAVTSAIGLSALELQFDLPFGGVVPSGPAGARSLLSSIITAMISFTALVFSITVVALQLASSQYSPRVLRTFLQDRTIQATLGTFVATFLFAMVVLAALPAQRDEGLPELSLAVSIALVLASSGTFIYYLHHITTVMRVSHIIGSIGAQTRRSIAQLPPPDQPSATVLGEVIQTVPATAPGMVSNIDLALLARLAREHDCAITVVPIPGDFVVTGAPLLRVHRTAGGTGRPVPADRAEQGVTIGVERTPGQDLGFGFRQLADISERALSPAVNDVTTAVRAIQEAHDLLRRLAARPDPVHVVRDDDGTVRARFTGISYDTILAMVIDDIRLVAGDQPRVMHLLDSIVRDLASVALPVHRATIGRRLPARGPGSH
ncbi:putative membrane protein [Micromonospora endolithica]|nr:putative membrane protein [Micromonospora endolithica]